MIDESPQSLLFFVVGAFAAGWLVAKLGEFASRRFAVKERDPREDRIRSLEAELRVARSSAAKIEGAAAERDKELAAATGTVHEYAKTINDQRAEIDKLRRDLRESVKKTHELRDELSDRAQENLHSTVKLKQVETELSVVRETADMMSTGRLDFNTGDDPESSASNVVKLKS
ncbi:MAG: hypothetical protein WBM54_14640 [Woeseia sp.]